jgi:RNA 3'-terminal phosphate cyclase
MAARLRVLGTMNETRRVYWLRRRAAQLGIVTRHCALFRAMHAICKGQSRYVAVVTANDPG